MIPGEGIVEIQEKLNTLEDVEYAIADEETIHAEQIMGTYQYIIDGNSPKEAAIVLQEIESAIEKKETTDQNSMSATERILAMIMTVYLVIATLYAAKLIQDKDTGTVERFCQTGAGKASYFGGYVASTAIIVAIQVSIAFLILSVFGSIIIPDGETMITVWAFIVLFATIYGVFHAFVYKKEMTANIISLSFAIILSILGGTFVAVTSMPVVLQWISWVSPVKWLLELI